MINRDQKRPETAATDPGIARELRDCLRHRIEKEGRWRTVCGGRVLTLRTVRFEATLFSPFNSLTHWLSPPRDYDGAAWKQHLERWPWQLVVVDDADHLIFSVRWNHADVIELVELQPSARRLQRAPKPPKAPPRRLPLLAAIDGGIQLVPQRRSS